MEEGGRVSLPGREDLLWQVEQGGSAPGKEKHAQAPFLRAEEVHAHGVEGVGGRVRTCLL